MTGQDRNEGRNVLHRRRLTEDRVLEIDNAFAREGRRECSGLLKIELERRVHDLKCLEIITLLRCV